MTKKLKMRLQIFSDFHIEFGTDVWKYVTPQAPVAVVAGDIDARNFVETLNNISLKFEKVIALAGNHDFYGKDINWMKDIQGLADNVSLLNPGTVEYEGVTFIGSTMWSDCNKNDWLCVNSAARNVNDFRLIKNGLARFNVPDMIDLHLSEVEYMAHAFNENKGKKIVAVTHFLPSYAMVHPQWGTIDPMNHYFAASCDDLVLDSGASLWIAGHTHNFIDVMIGDVRCVANPIGYPGERRDFKDLIIEV